jgi:hypothetical protein
MIIFGQEIRPVPSEGNTEERSETCMPARGLVAEVPVFQGCKIARALLLELLGKQQDGSDCCENCNTL